MKNGKSIISSRDSRFSCKLVIYILEQLKQTQKTVLGRASLTLASIPSGYRAVLDGLFSAGSGTGFLAGKTGGSGTGADFSNPSIFRCYLIAELMRIRKPQIGCFGKFELRLDN